MPRTGLRSRDGSHRDFAMMTSGIVVRFDTDLSGRDAAVAAVGAEPVFTVGEVRPTGLSVALEARDAAESERWLDWLRRLPGVAAAEVVFVHWDAAEVAGA